MDTCFRRLLLCAAFSPDSPRLGQALRELSPDRDRLDRFCAYLPKNKSKNLLLNSSRELEMQYQTLQAAGWRWLALGDDDYPALLADLPDAPGVIGVRGNPAALSRPQLAMVGARSASPDGLDNAHRFARSLAGAGFAITSGLALGVDGAAHRGALAAGGVTVAVLGSGPDRLYPARHRQLAKAIVEGGGALVSEFAPGAQPRREYFPLRNRIISGLSLATLVIEAALRSGSLITARDALEQGREVFAVPGSIHNPLSKGCHRLLRDGANWLESVDDVLNAFGDFRRTIEHSPALGADSSLEPGAEHRPASRQQPALLRYFGTGVNRLDDLCQRSGLTVAELAGLLSDLELEGHVQRVAGGYVVRHSPLMK